MKRLCHLDQRPLEIFSNPNDSVISVMHQLWTALENSDAFPYVLMPMPDLFLPVQVFPPLLCRYLFTVQRVTGKLLSSMPARMPSGLCEVLKQPERFEKIILTSLQDSSAMSKME